MNQSSTPQKNDIENKKEDPLQKKTEKLTQAFNTIRHLLDTLRDSYEDYLLNPTRWQAKIDKIIQAIYAQGKEILDTLKEINSSKLVADYQLQLKTVWVEFYDLKQDYTLNTHTLDKTYLQANDPNASTKEIETLLLATMNQHSSMDASAFNKLITAQETLNYVTARHKQLLVTEASVAELNQLAIDTLILVKMQGETIEKIREKIENAKEDIKDGKGYLEEAMMWSNGF